MKKFRRRSARMNLMHYRVLVARYFRQIFSSLGTLLPLVLQAPVMLVIVWLVSRKDAFTLKSPDALTGANVTLFMLVIMSALMGILNSYREICKERDILSREVFGGLDITAYVLSKVTVLSVVGIVQCAVLFGGTLIFIDFAFPSSATGYVCCYAAMALTNISVAILPGLFIIIVQVVFCVSLFSLEGAAGWVRYVTPSAWAIAVMSHECALNDWAPQIFQKPMFDLNPLIGLAVLAAIALAFTLLTILRLKRVYRQKD